jgi:hypothetical protein
LKYQRLRTARLRLDHGFLHEGVRVTAGNEINSVDLRGDL